MNKRDPFNHCHPEARLCPKELAVSRFHPNATIFVAALAIMALCVFALGCHSTGVNVTIQNNAKVPLRNVEFDYPGATFGTSNIAPGGSFWYHIKPTKEGPVTLSFDEENGKSFKQTGPTVHQGKDERLILIVDQDAAGKWRISVGENATK